MTTNQTVDQVSDLITKMLQNYRVDITKDMDGAYLTDLGIFQLSHHLTGALIAFFDITPAAKKKE
jgi:hypothetical protein